MIKKKLLVLPCIAAFALALYVGKNVSDLNEYDSNGLLLKNVEALSFSENAGYKAITHVCPFPIEYKKSVTCLFGVGDEYYLKECFPSDC